MKSTHQNPESIHPAQSGQRQRDNDNGVETGAEKPIDTVVDSIIKKNNSNSTSLQPGENYANIYSSIHQVLSGFNTSITDCKKYNEAKIHRKYEIRIADLEEEIKILRQKIYQEQSARDPSKKYVEKLVDQLVIYKNENEKLKDEAKILQQLNESLMEKTEKTISGSRFVGNRDHSVKKSTISLSMVSGSEQEEDKKFDLKEEVEKFLSTKREMKKNLEDMRSRFQIFLKRNRERLDYMTFGELLFDIDEWTSQSERKNQGIRAERLRSNVLSTLDDGLSSSVQATNLAAPYYLPHIQKPLPAKKKHNHSRLHYSTLQVAAKRCYTLTLK